MFVINAGRSIIRPISFKQRVEIFQRFSTFKTKNLPRSAVSSAGIQNFIAAKPLMAGIFLTSSWVEAK